MKHVGDVQHNHEVNVKTDLGEEIKKLKEHVRKNRETYIQVGCGLVFAGFTWSIMRGVVSQRISPAIGGTTSRAIGVTGESNAIQNVVSGKNNTLHSVSFISANRLGPPSWVTRCIETNEITTSQRAMATLKGISESHLSEHLTGVRDHVNDLHFERICMAA